MAENSLLNRLDGIEARFEEVSTLITDPAVIADMKRYVKLNKEYRELEKLTAATRRYKGLLNDIDEAKELLEAESDPEMKQMAREQLDAATAGLPALEEEIKILLIPADPEDSKNAIVEIRGGTGGDEAALFAGDLFKMYTRYCEQKGWQVAVTSFNEGTAGGFKEIVFAVSGENVYGTLKYESGVHRVQRVPATETQGRVHTSAATVAVLPLRRGDQRRGNKMGDLPQRGGRRTERQQSGVGSAPALHVEKSRDRPDRRDTYRMYGDPRPAQKQGEGTQPSAHVHI